VNWSAVTSFLTAVTAVGALIFTAQSLNATRDQVANAEQGQLTERYSRAIEQLGQQGPERLQVRLGGIYALERLARDSPRDQPTIIEVLLSFVRTTVGQEPRSRPTEPYDAACAADTPTAPRPDVQAALTVLGRRDTAHDDTATLDLSGTCLRGANLRGANLAKADLDGTHLAGANLQGARLSHANLSKANFVGAVLWGVDLRSANLASSDLTDASLRLANLGSANLFQSNVTEANLDEVNLADANLMGANLRHTGLIHANLKHALLFGANLDAANFTDADLSGADLEGVEHDLWTVVNGARTDSATRGRWWP
jgi:hypothetical protein